jgi:hypothetical protein
MKSLFRNPINAMLFLLSLVLFFHLLLVLKVIPYTIAWGGRLENDEAMYAFESMSILVNLFLMWILAMKGNYVRFQFSPRAQRIALWIFLVLFALNTLGNIVAKTNLEKSFAVVTALFAYLLWKIVRDNKGGVSECRE